MNAYIIDKKPNSIGPTVKRVLKTYELDEVVFNEHVAALKLAASDDETEKRRGERHLANWISHEVFAWQVGQQASCWKYTLGLWATIPPFPTYDVSLRWNDGGQVAVSDRTVKQWISFGLGWAPSAYVSVLGGLSYNTLRIEDATGNDDPNLQRSARFWSWTLAVAVNADIVTALAKN